MIARKAGEDLPSYVGRLESSLRNIDPTAFNRYMQGKDEFAKRMETLAAYSQEIDDRVVPMPELLRGEISPAGPPSIDREMTWVTGALSEGEFESFSKKWQFILRPMLRLMAQSLNRAEWVGPEILAYQLRSKIAMALIQQSGGSASRVTVYKAIINQLLSKARFPAVKGLPRKVMSSPDWWAMLRGGIMFWDEYFNISRLINYLPKNTIEQLKATEGLVTDEILAAAPGERYTRDFHFMSSHALQFTFFTGILQDHGQEIYAEIITNLKAHPELMQELLGSADPGIATKNLSEVYHLQRFFSMLGDERFRGRLQWKNPFKKSALHSLWIFDVLGAKYILSPEWMMETIIHSFGEGF